MAKREENGKGHAVAIPEAGAFGVSGEWRIAKGAEAGRGLW